MLSRSTKVIRYVLYLVDRKRHTSKTTLFVNQSHCLFTGQIVLVHCQGIGRLALAVTCSLDNHELVSIVTDHRVYRHGPSCLSSRTIVSASLVCVVYPPIQRRLALVVEDGPRTRRVESRNIGVTPSQNDVVLSRDPTMTSCRIQQRQGPTI